MEKFTRVAGELILLGKLFKECLKGETPKHNINSYFYHRAAGDLLMYLKVTFLLWKNILCCPENALHISFSRPTTRIVLAMESIHHHVICLCPRFDPAQSEPSGKPDMTVLHYAIIQENKVLASKLIDLGSDVNLPDR